MSHQKKKKKRQKINHQMASDKIEMVGERERERERIPNCTKGKEKSGTK